MNDLYRDPLVHVHARIAELEARASSLTARLAAVPLFWEHHVEEKSQADALTTQLAQDGVSLAPSHADSFDRAERLSTLVAMLEALALRVPEHESALSQIPHGHPPAQPHVPSGSLSLLLGDKTSEIVGMMEKLTRTMRAIDEHAIVRGEGVLRDARIVVVTLTSGGVPFTYTGALLARAGQYPVLGSHVATYVRRDVASLEVRPKTAFASLFRMLRARENMRTGDAEFDAAFAVTLHRGVQSLAPLTAASRAALLEISRCDPPTLLVDAGIARLFWSFELTTPTFSPLIRAALRVLREVRRAARAGESQR